MSDVPPGAGARGASAGLEAPTGPALTPESYRDTDTDPSAGERAQQVAHQGKQAAGDVKDTAKEQGQRVVDEARTQARSLASDVRDRVGEQARGQHDKLVGSIRQTADQLDEMRGDRAGSPAGAVVSRVAEGGRQFADYLDRNGPDGVLREVQAFARRRPGAFLATALAAGFVVGRLGKSVAKADGDAGETRKPESDAFVSHDPGPAVTAPVTPPVTAPVTAPVTPAPTAYGEGVPTEYASTGTGTPDVVGYPPATERPGGPL
ncbi:hypothetical protein [Actinoplanes sp. NBRC 103695]|uniref:hypothetical protein n=1 Tax=Actinoplanes sp. NBRC 103695 TaxID=3032202 RepID=UPI0024A40C60|nr:hypothetical protein [Actinoplanes sp. NBRC 103695]GLY94371.1 hypothetical protein Acsp02_16270 [Actinoplanes sp. NBRC 103695]